MREYQHISASLKQIKQEVTQPPDQLAQLSQQLSEKESLLKAAGPDEQSNQLMREILVLRGRIADLKTTQALARNSSITSKLQRSLACIEKHWINREYRPKIVTTREPRISVSLSPPRQNSPPPSPIPPEDPPPPRSEPQWEKVAATVQTLLKASDTVHQASVEAAKDRAFYRAKQQKLVFLSKKINTLSDCLDRLA